MSDKGTADEAHEGPGEEPDLLEQAADLVDAHFHVFEATVNQIAIEILQELEPKRKALWAHVAAVMPHDEFVRFWAQGLQEAARRVVAELQDNQDQGPGQGGQP